MSRTKYVWDPATKEPIHKKRGGVTDPDMIKVLDNWRHVRKQENKDTIREIDNKLQQEHQKHFKAINNELKHQPGTGHEYQKAMKRFKKMSVNQQKQKSIKRPVVMKTTKPTKNVATYRKYVNPNVKKRLNATPKKS